MEYPKEVAREVAALRPDLCAGDAVSAVLTADPSLSAARVIEILDETRRAPEMNAQHTDLTFAANLGAETAGELNDNPNERQNWSPLEQTDDLPEFDHVALREHYGDVTREIERAYRDAFNTVFSAT